MPTLAELTDPYVGSYRPVLPAGPGVCLVCHSQPGPRWETCWSCANTAKGLAHPLDRVIPVAMCENGGQLHRLLRHYKDPRQAEAVRNQATLRLAGLLGRFLVTHEPCITSSSGSLADGIVPVPSTGGRGGIHPLAAMLGLLAVVGDRLAPVLVPGPEPANHNTPSDRSFESTADVEGRVLLVIDDTFTSGARAQSAASVLQARGARVTAVVAIGRFLYPERCPELWSRIEKKPYDFKVCCLDDPGS
jgi:predicted amidophosphoribosyltransferase